MKDGFEKYPSYHLTRLSARLTIVILSFSFNSTTIQSSGIVLYHKKTQRDFSQSKFLHLKHVQPIHHHHSLDQISFQIDVPAYAHRVSPGLDVPLPRRVISTQAPRKNTYTPSNLLLCTVAFHVPKCSSPLFRTSIPTDSSKIIIALLP